MVTTRDLRTAMRPARLRALGIRTGAGVVTTLLALALVLSGCTQEAPRPSPSPSASPPRPFTVMTTDRILTADPAAVADAGSMILTLNVFQTLMTADPGSDALTPDAADPAAKDCSFQSKTVYVCTLKKNLTFSNGDELTSSDVKFSIDRAMRLNVAGSSASLLSSIRRIETPTPLTVKFVLSQEDTQIGWALAAPAASIVDEQVYSPDTIQPNDAPIVGSGPFMVTRLAKNELQLARFPKYKGRRPAQLDALVVRTEPDSAAIEEAMTKHKVDLVWRGLSTAALTRFDKQLTGSDHTKAGFTRLSLPGARVRELIWNPDSRQWNNAALRTAIENALQEDRTLDSIVPSGVPGHVAAFKVGGQAKVKVTWKQRIILTLGYDKTMPNGLDQASMIRTRLEAAGGMSVRLVATNAAGEPATDLRLEDRKAWTSNAIAWMQPYLAHPPKKSATKVQQWDAEFRSSTDAAQRTALLAKLQRQAATDAVVLPISQADEQVFAAQGVTLDPTSFGPGYQLGLWGISHG